MSDIEWLRDEVVDAETYVAEIPEARALVIGPDDRLVVVMPGWLNMQEIDRHAARIREAIGNRFVILAGDDIRLAKVNGDDWDRPAIGR